MAPLKAYDIMCEDPASDFPGCHIWYIVMVLANVILDLKVELLLSILGLP